MMLYYHSWDLPKACFNLTAGIYTALILAVERVVLEIIKSYPRIV